jgi:ParB family chromosome partitioning protein
METKDKNIKNGNVGNIKNDGEYREVRKSDIIPSKRNSRKRGLNPENDKYLEESIKKDGLLNPLTVKEVGNGKFEMLAGTRRLEAITTDTVWVHVKKNVDSDYDAMRVNVIENLHRDPPDDFSRDDFYYEMYKRGKEEGKVRRYSDVAKDINKDPYTITRYIKAGEERAKNKNNDLISKAKTSLLTDTRPLKNIPKVRNILLEMGQQKIIQIKNIPELTNKIETCIKKGMTERMITKIIDMSTSNVDETVNNNRVDVNDNKNVNEPVDNNQVNGNSNVDKYVKKDNNVDNKKDSDKPKFDMSKFDTISSVMAVSHPDVREYIVSKKIDIKDAGKINSFETVEARRQLVEEKVKIDNWKKKSQETYDKEWDHNIDTRKKQEEDIKTKGDTELKTMFDIDHQRKLDLAKDADNRHDEDYFRRYRSLQDQLNRTVLYYHPKKVKTEKGKEVVNGIVKAMYEILRLVLIETGGIKTGTGTGTGSNENGFGHHFVDVEVKVTEDVET